MITALGMMRITNSFHVSVDQKNAVAILCERDHVGELVKNLKNQDLVSNLF